MTRRPLTLPSPPPGARGFADPYDPARAKKLLAPALALIPFYPYSAPYGDLRLKP